MDILTIGINFRTAPVEVRERVSFGPKAIPEVLRKLNAAFPEHEFALVSTCNRTELYVAGPDLESQTQSILGTLLEDKGLDGDTAGEHFYILHRLAAAEHLFAVSAGLDSMVVGEAEILGQVKRAYGLSIDAETSGDQLHTLFQNAFKTAKYIRTHTGICQGRVSVSTIAVEFVEKVFDDLSTKTVMIVGAGETAELVLKCLIEKGAGDVLVLNRSQPKCQSLAERYGGRPIPFDLLDDYLPRADIVMSSTSAPHCIVRAASVHAAMRARQGQPMLLMDIAVPRDIEAAVADIENVYLYDIDDLQKIAADNLAKRQAEVRKAWTIVRTHTVELASRFKTVGFGPLMARLSAKAQEASDIELDGLFNKPAFASLSDSQRKEIASLLRRAVGRILGEPRKALRRASSDGRWETYAEVARDLFGLNAGDKTETDEAKAPEKE